MAAVTIGLKMFERYTERARRVFFYARYETTQLGGYSIENEHMLLGLIRLGTGVANQIFVRANLPLEAIRQELEIPKGPPTDPAIEIPFSNETKQLLTDAAQEAEQLNEKHIGTEHLLLGLLRAEGTVAASILASNGLRLDAVRREIVTLRDDSSSGVGRST
jgi:ATP-dependent Clp protease ATP-binding subunit ClpC